MSLTACAPASPNTNQVDDPLLDAATTDAMETNAAETNTLSSEGVSLANLGD